MPLRLYFSWSGRKHIPRNFVKRHLSADVTKPWVPTRFYKLTWHGRTTPSDDVMQASYLPCTHHSVSHSSHPERALCHQGLHCRTSWNCNMLHMCICSVASTQYSVHVYAVMSLLETPYLIEAPSIWSARCHKIVAPPQNRSTGRFEYELYGIHRQIYCLNTTFIAQDHHGGHDNLFYLFGLVKAIICE